MIKRSFLLAAAAAIGAARAGGFCAAAPPECKFTRIAEWPVRLEHNKLIVDGAINGRTIGIILDTGGRADPDPALGGDTAGTDAATGQSLSGFWARGETDVDIAHLDEFKIGQVAQKNWQVVVAGERDFGDDVAFLLGEDFFHKVDVEFDLAAKAVRLYQSKDYDGVSLAYWSTNGASQTDIEEVDGNHSHIVLTVQINGQPLRALLDSGASTTMLATSDVPGWALRRKRRASSRAAPAAGSAQRSSIPGSVHSTALRSATKRSRIPRSVLLSCGRIRRTLRPAAVCSDRPGYGRCFWARTSFLYTECSSPTVSAGSISPMLASRRFHRAERWRLLRIQARKSARN